MPGGLRAEHGSPALEHEEHAAEVRRLRLCLSNLLALMALPATWSTQNVAEIAGTTLDVLVAALRLDFVCVRLEPSVDIAAFETARVPLGHWLADDPAAVCGHAAPWFARDGGGKEDVERDLAGAGEIRVARRQLGLHGDLGVLVAGASRPDFPNALERLLLGVACNQAAMGLHDTRRRLEQRRSDVLRAERRELEATFEATLNERTRIAREMHDTLLQGFTGVVLHLTTLARGTAHPPETRDAMDRLVTLAQQTLTEGRMAVSGLRAAADNRRDFLDAVRSVAEETLARWNVGVRHEVLGTPRAIGQGVELTVLRVTREALTNVIKHAQASGVCIRVAFGADHLEVTVADDGRGFLVDERAAAAGDHWGLVGMRERALEVSGSLRVRSELGTGTEIMLRVPYAASAFPAGSATAEG